MTADLPWLNDHLATLLSTLTDVMPKPYATYYKSINIAGTYFVVLTLIILLCIIFKIVDKFCSKSSETVESIK